MRVRQRGLSLVAALFLIVVLAAIGTFAVRIGVAAQQNATAALLEHRAMAAAYAGIEIGANRSLANSGCPPDVSLPQGFTVTIECELTSPQNYRITATARRGTYGSAEFVARRVVRTFSSAP